jgi:uncharacterized RDD family membrane protein YckC
VIDTLRPVSLPEGVEITLRLAGPLARARAWLIDFGLRTMVMMSLPALFSMLGEAGMGLTLIAWFGISVMYPIVFEALWNGATPGKRVCNLAVVHGDGTPIGWSAAFVRNVVRFADILPFGYAVGLSTMMLDGQFRRLGDLAAGTIVIHREPLAAAAAKAKAEAPSAIPAHAPFSLTPLEQRAVLDFAERRRTWSAERAAELAEVAAPLVDGRHGEAAVTRVVAIAAGLVQRR